MTSREQSTLGPRLIFIAVLGCGFAWLNSRQLVPSPVPVPAQQPGEIVTAQTDVSRALTRHLRDVIEQLESGKLTDEQATRDLLAAGVKAANQAAWLPVKERDAAAFADGWTPQKQIQRLKLMLGD